MSQGDGINRRQFLAGSAAAAMMLMVGAEELKADPPPPTPAPTGPPIGCGVIGLGFRGRDILSALAKQPGANIIAICDTYQPASKRGLEIAPKAASPIDYHQLLDNKAVDAVFVATPTYLHRQITLDAIAAGKHVYCEAPLASTLDDAKAIAVGGQGSAKIFQVGLQQRTNPQVTHVLKFIETGTLGDTAQVRTQWHKRTSWRKPAPTDAREKEINWRLSRATSSGLVGEEGVHHIDMTNWFLKSLPLSATGMGGVLAWKDGRDVFDTVQLILEYPNNLHMLFDATLASSYDASYDLFMGSLSTILLKENRAWMFQEADSPTLGWEVYARKDKIGDETGIALVADATKQLTLGLKPAAEKPPDPNAALQDELSQAVGAFLQSVRDNKKPDAGPLEGYQSAVVAIKANDAIQSGSTVSFQKEMFDLA
ncbi:MAG TPA: Gfo/Idh/MocA family oxidoreductase [Armatimonadota bacterium]|nr:Gfo/Idh/MocA family oxidoreductase [Armatimonadota bacterium]